MSDSMQSNQYTVIVDSREKKPWIFDKDEYCSGSIIKKLDTADYSLLGLEDKFVIERKRNTSEFSQNIFQKRFERELQRLDNFIYPFLICEFDYVDMLSFPINSGIPQSLYYKVKISPDFLIKAITRYYFKYKTKIIFAGKNGQLVAKNLFKFAMREFNVKKDI